MRKNNRFGAILMAVLLFGFVANAFADSNERLIYSLDRGFGITGNRGNIGTPLKQDYDVAIRINDKHFVGMTIAAVRVPIDTDEEPFWTKGMAVERTEARSGGRQED